MRDFLFSYDDITLIPKHSSLKSRADGDTSIEFLGRKFKLPIIPATMKDVIDHNIAKYLSENGYFYIYHRFGKYNTSYYPIHSFVVIANQENWKLISISVGVNKQDINILTDLKNGHSNYRIDFITIDLAHADHENVKPMIHFIRETYPYAKLIVGNVATAEGYKYLYDLKVDAIKCGIGNGSICSTRFKTGFYVPTAYSVYECNQLGLDVPIIADGGIKHFGDISKSLVLGASLAMSGKLFAECIDSPALIRNGKKIYRGSTSVEAKGNNNHIEGYTIELVEGITYQERLKEISDALKSSISYAGGHDLSCFNNVKWKLLR